MVVLIQEMEEDERILQERQLLLPQEKDNYNYIEREEGMLSL